MLLSLLLFGLPVAAQTIDDVRPDCVIPGGRILLFLEEQGRSRGMTLFILHAQEYVKSFYAGHGYVEHGDVFLEVDIPHVEMRKGG